MRQARRLQGPCAADRGAAAVRGSPLGAPAPPPAAAEGGQKNAPRSGDHYALLAVAVACLLLASCDPPELVTLPEIDTSGSPDGIVDLPADVPEVFHKYFDRYAYFPTPDGRRIHFLASRGWTRDQIKHGLNVMEHLLADHPGSVYGDDKSVIAAAMADRKATMVFFDNEPDMRQAMSEGLADATDLSMQDLRANECPAPGDADYMGHVTRDAAYEEIWHLIHDYGIKPTLPEMIAEMRTANDEAAEKGWYAWPRDVPDDHPNEYVGALIDNYYDLWTVPPTVYEGRDIAPDEIPEGFSHFGQYFAGSRAAMPEKDPLGYALVTGFVGPHLTYTPELPLDFSGTFSMTFDPEVRYTMKTQHLRNVALTGDGDANLRGNAHDNVLTGNAGANRLEGGGGNDTLDGGEGSDTAVFSGPAADYEVATGEDGVTVNDSQPDRDGVGHAAGRRVPAVQRRNRPGGTVEQPEGTACATRTGETDEVDSDMRGIHAEMRSDCGSRAAVGFMRPARTRHAAGDRHVGFSRRHRRPAGRRAGGVP